MPLARPLSLLALALLAGCTQATAIPRQVVSVPLALAPPPPGEGIQLSFGPFGVASGQELQRNFYQKLPTTQDVDVSRIEIAYKAGSHHFNVFKSDTLDVPDKVEDSFGAVAWEAWDLMVGSQSTSLDWTLPPGVAFKLKARQQMIFQTHYVNAKTQFTPDTKGEVKINFWFAKPGTTTSYVGTVFANNRTIRIPPRQKAAFTTGFALPTGSQILAMTGHFHSRGRVFDVDCQTPTNTDALFRSQNWDEPPFRILATPYAVPAGGEITYTCGFDNTNSDLDIKFGPKVETDEHCNLFLYYYPSDGKTKYFF